MRPQQTMTSEHLLERKTQISQGQIQAVKLLQLPSQKLTQFLIQEMTHNPALDGEQHELCPICQQIVGLPNGLGCDCGQMIRQKDQDDTRINDGREDWDMSMQSVRGAGSFDDDDDDPLARVSGRNEYGAGLLLILRAMVPEEDAAIAEYLIGSLNSHGWLSKHIVDEASYECGVDLERVEFVLDALQHLDPAGIGARSAQESLLLQLERLREQGQPRELAERLIRDHFDDLAAKHFREIARALGLPPRMIESELNFISKHLHPFPAHGFDPDLSGVAVGASPVRPDVVIRRTLDGFEADIVEQRRWNLRISDSYQEVRRIMKHNPTTGTNTDREQVRRAIDDATNLISALRQRWHTMQRVADALIELQRDYLERGPSGLAPLTRKDVGEKIKLHESTVSRATDGKFVLLPNGKTVPFDDFFNDSLQAKEAITDLVEREDPRHPYSDEQLAALLKRNGMEVARRTVAKYREEIGILPSRLRRNRLAQRAVVTC